MLVQCYLETPVGQAKAASLGSRWFVRPLAADTQGFWQTVLWVPDNKAMVGTVVTLAHPDTGRTESWTVVRLGCRQQERHIVSCRL